MRAVSLQARPSAFLPSAERCERPSVSNWSAATLWLNTSIISLYNSQKATTQFQNPGVYYNPPTRKFTYDINFMDPAKQPPGIPTALVFIRNSYTIPAGNTISSL